MKGQTALGRIECLVAQWVQCCCHWVCLYWISHPQCCVLATHSAVVKVQVGCNRQGKAETSTSLSGECPSCVHIPHHVGAQLYSKSIRRENTCGLERVNHTGIGAACTGQYTVVEDTLRVKHLHRIVLWFMGTAEESRVH